MPPRRSRDPPKRSVRREAHGSPVSVGGIPLSARFGSVCVVAARRRRKPGDDGLETGRVWVLVDGVLGSRDGSDVSRSRSSMQPQGCPGVRDLAGKKSSLECGKPPRLTRAAVDGRRMGARVVRGILNRRGARLDLTGAKARKASREPSQVSCIVRTFDLQGSGARRCWPSGSTLGRGKPLSHERSGTWSRQR